MNTDYEEEREYEQEEEYQDGQPENIDYSRRRDNKKQPLHYNLTAEPIVDEQIARLITLMEVQTNRPQAS